MTALKRTRLFTAFSLLLLVACHSARRDRASVEAAMNYYDHLIQKLDADSIHA